MRVLHSYVKVVIYFSNKFISRVQTFPLVSILRCEISPNPHAMIPPDNMTLTAQTGQLPYPRDFTKSASGLNMHSVNFVVKRFPEADVCIAEQAGPFFIADSKNSLASSMFDGLSPPIVLDRSSIRGDITLADWRAIKLGCIPNLSRALSIAPKVIAK